MKKVLLVTFILAFASGVVNASPAYDEMICSIERWLESNEEAHFLSVSSQELFEFRLEIDSLDWGRSESDFLKINNLMQQLGDRSFDYDYRTYNNESLRQLLLTRYPSRLYGDPIVFFLEQYHWYQTNITDKAKQMYWLLEYLEFLEWLFGDKNIKENFVRNHRNIVVEIIMQTMALTGDKEAEEFDSQYIPDSVWVFGSGSETILLRLNSFLSVWSNQMTEDEKTEMINWLIPTYAESDYAVKIYRKLSGH